MFVDIAIIIYGTKTNHFSAVWGYTGNEHKAIHLKVTTKYEYVLHDKLQNFDG